MRSRGLDPQSLAGRGGSVAGSWRKKLCQKPRAARLYGVLNCDMAIPDTPDRTYVLERGCGVCVGKRTYLETPYDCRCGQILDVQCPHLADGACNLLDKVDTRLWPLFHFITLSCSARPGFICEREDGHIHIPMDRKHGNRRGVAG